MKKVYFLLALVFSFFLNGCEEPAKPAPVPAPVPAPPPLTETLIIEPLEDLNTYKYQIIYFENDDLSKPVIVKLEDTDFKFARKSQKIILLKSMNHVGFEVFQIPLNLCRFEYTYYDLQNIESIKNDLVPNLKNAFETGCDQGTELKLIDISQIAKISF